MQDGNDVDYPGVISISCQRSRYAVIGCPSRAARCRPANAFMRQ